MPKLSIVIPNYNGGENLKRSIESCKTIQITEDNYEILVASLGFDLDENSKNKIF